MTKLSAEGDDTITHIEITLELDTLLRKTATTKLAANRTQHEIPLSCTLDELISSLGLRGKISFAVVNGDRHGFEYMLQQGDEVMLFPYLIGG
ncbi:MAG TPA: MoaD/ThiS family protein [Verrucomicrobiae bacterium]|nr:MoaD/ThiS family protein [Verrucomicrobiae bacterium]